MASIQCFRCVTVSSTSTGGPGDAPRRGGGLPEKPAARSCSGVRLQRVSTTVEMLRAGTVTVARPPVTLIGWLAALAVREVT
ncbi:hypothetical protein GCM10012284_23550 [Mangrovihabitans endophyticus]|uniref:Uncharacterized protein n=1 Tax=Mangrovihabitans endophyticus TaxID=1751298 RepID=A0A8J3C046_9ACTN|nr:hypothetical protein GCM10012284_23550 [Mangrovihabitans endophyticus]